MINNCKKKLFCIHNEWPLHSPDDVENYLNIGFTISTTLLIVYTYILSVRSIQVGFKRYVVRKILLFGIPTYIKNVQYFTPSPQKPQQQQQQNYIKDGISACHTLYFVSSLYQCK